jgi:glucuronoarabinoxylan endo-1,4-beta-xylanase
MRKSISRIFYLVVIFSILFLYLPSVSGNALATNTITLNKKVTHQTMDGFGACATWPIAQLMENYSEKDQKAILDFLFTPQGMDLSMVRLEINADYKNPAKPSSSKYSTIEPVEGVWDWDTDQHQKWLAKEAMARGVSRFMASAWSPPVWMKKDTFSFIGGSINPAYIGHYADYLKTYAVHYANDFGINVGWVSIQNEPDYNAPWQSCVYSPEDMIPVINTTLKSFSTQGIGTKLLAPETTNASIAYSYMFSMDFDTNPPASSKLYAIAYHDYTSSIEPMLQNFERPMWLTETSGLDKEDITMTDGLLWSNSVLSHLNNGTSAYFYWLLVSPDNCKDRQGLIRLESNADSRTYTIPKRAYAIGQYSRFIRPGYIRIDSKSSNSALKQLAFKDPTNSKAVMVVTNDSTQDQSALVSGFTAENLKVYRTSDTENISQLSDISTAAGAMNMTFPARSITTLVEDISDTGAPSTISNLKAENGIDGIKLSWAAPGDTKNSGVANRYDIRVSSDPITATNFSTAAEVKGPPAPLAAGSVQNHFITGLEKGETYYFAMKTLDEAGNTSNISNIASIKFNPTPLKPIPPTNVRVKANNQYMIFDIQPQIIKGTAAVQLRPLMEALGVEVQWDGKDKSITCKKDNTSVRMQIGSNEAIVNGDREILKASAYLVSGRTMIPARFLAETFGFSIDWNGTTRTIAVN